ncbi:hypothetical protein LX32DRAFT_325467 [Colletotrichum zoysiae]|uniref:Uncharacterized protein n=1 Tax=Colletotrichum zoysiae TaxID=1216348 RepID=A0AAD9M3E2_9PEZI|nr:hypothetical protein LX32DRAFT_325467 [Colletotrichum zoysiae]
MARARILGYLLPPSGTTSYQLSHMQGPLFTTGPGGAPRVSSVSPCVSLPTFLFLWYTVVFMLTLPCNVTFLPLYLSVLLARSHIQCYYYCKRHPRLLLPIRLYFSSSALVPVCRCVRTSGQYFVEVLSSPKPASSNAGVCCLAT